MMQEQNQPVPAPADQESLREEDKSNRPFDEKSELEAKVNDSATVDTEDLIDIDIESGERMVVEKEQKSEQTIEEEELYSIPNDVYTLFFVSDLGGSACLYSIYVFGLKLALYTFLALDTYRGEAVLTTSDKIVLAAQFLMIPIAVAMQTDLIDTYQIVANVKYCAKIRESNPGASQWKYRVSTLARFLDGAYSLMVNFVVICSAQAVLELFLNFAALHFLQDIDNVALDMAAKGYLSDQMEKNAAAAEAAHLPKRSSKNILRSMDTTFFVSTLLLLFATWTSLFILRRDDE